MSDAAHPDHDLIFGARAHDPGYWRAHPMVRDSRVEFDGPHGWVGFSLRSTPTADRCVAKSAGGEATRNAPDLYFWGEGDCPLELFETAPRVRELLVWVEGPTPGDDRTCWSVGIWLLDLFH